MPCKITSHEDIETSIDKNSMLRVDTNRAVFCYFVSVALAPANNVPGESVLVGILSKRQVARGWQYGIYDQCMGSRDEATPFNLGGRVIFAPDEDVTAVVDWDRLLDLPTPNWQKSGNKKKAKVKLNLWDSQRVKIIRCTVPGQKGYYNCARWPDGRFLACGRGSGKVLKVWDANNGKLLQTFKEHYGPGGHFAFSVDATTVASYGYSRTRRGIPYITERMIMQRVVRVWDVNSGQMLRQIEVGMGRGLCFALTPRGHFGCRQCVR